MTAETRVSQQTQISLEEENCILKPMVNETVVFWSNVLPFQKGIDHMSQYYIAKANILAVRRVKESDMTKMARATTTARVVNSLDEIISKDHALPIFWRKGR
jgi:chaperonin GroEL (HSP60 family)